MVLVSARQHRRGVCAVDVLKTSLCKLLVAAKSDQNALSPNEDSKSLCSLRMHLSMQRRRNTHRKEENSGGGNTVEFCFLRLFFLMTRASDIVPSVHILHGY